MKVINEIAYHYHQSNEWNHLWQIGNRFNIDNQSKNNFIKYYDSYTCVYHINGLPHHPKKAAKELKKYLQYLGPQDFSDYLDFSLAVFSECGMYIREQIFEEIRKIINPELPSRLSCIWVFRDISNKYWATVLNPESILYKVKLNGEMFIADQLYLFDEIKQHDIIREDAKKYWKGSSGSDPEHEECLFLGSVEILEKVEIKKI